MTYLAAVLSGDDSTVPICLACALAHPPTHSGAPLRIQVHAHVAHLETVAQSFEELLRQPKQHGAGMVQAGLSPFAALAQHSRDSVSGSTPSGSQQVAGVSRWHLGLAGVGPGPSWPSRRVERLNRGAEEGECCYFGSLDVGCGSFFLLVRKSAPITVSRLVACRELMLLLLC